MGTDVRVKGLYIHGPAGAGKSMAMDLFHVCLLHSNVRTARLHFHEFMYRTHQALFQLKLGSSKSQSQSASRSLRQFAQMLKDGTEDEKMMNLLPNPKGVDVLCFDELAITVIQDCTILTTLLTHISDCGITIITTSNRAPENLYEDGLNRYLYMPKFLEVLKSCQNVREVVSKDWRYESLALERTRSSSDLEKEEGNILPQIFFPKTIEKSESKILEKAQLSENFLSETMELKIGYGRILSIHSCSKDKKTAARFSFGELFTGPPFFGPDDYNAIADRFDTILISGVPKLDVSMHNEAKRFTCFLDCVYEHHSRLVCLNMETSDPEELFENLLPLENITLESVVGGMEGENSGAGQIGSGDQDQSDASSGVLSAVRSVKESIETNQQSCYFLSKDHKNWSVENKIVETREKPPSGKKEKSPLASFPKETLVASSDGDEIVTSVDKNFDSSRGNKFQGPDMDIWRQDKHGMPQVTRNWDEKRRHSQNQWESEDPTSEQNTVKGVFVAAVASLHETGFAVKRAVSRMQELQTGKYQRAAQLIRGREQ